MEGAATGDGVTAEVSPAEVGLGESNNVILAAQVRHALALSRLIAYDGSWIEAQEFEGLILKSSDAISHCVLVGTYAPRAGLPAIRACRGRMCSRGSHPSRA